MSVIIPPGFAQVSIEHWLTAYNRPAVTTWGIDLSGNAADADSVAQQQWSIYTTHMGPQIDSTVTIRDCRVAIGQDGGDPILGFSTGSTAGGRSAESTPPALALMITKRTNSGGRRGRGRIYIPWALSDTAVSENGAIAGASLTAWGSAASAWRSALAAANRHMVLLHGSGLTAPPAPTPVENLVVNPTIRTQRRRQARY